MDDRSFIRRTEELIARVSHSLAPRINSGECSHRTGAETMVCEEPSPYVMIVLQAVQCAVFWHTRAGRMASREALEFDATKLANEMLANRNVALRRLRVRFPRFPETGEQLFEVDGQTFSRGNLGQAFACFESNE